MIGGVEPTAGQIVTIELGVEHWLAIVARMREVIEASQRGEAGATVRAEVREVSVTSLPEGVDPGVVIEAIADQVRDGALIGIEGVADESLDLDVDGRLVVQLGQDADLMIVRTAVLEVIALAHSDALAAAARICDAEPTTLRAPWDSAEAAPRVRVSLDRSDWDRVLIDVERRIEIDDPDGDLTPTSDAQMVADAIAPHLYP